jgi:hypothetical protein
MLAAHTKPRSVLCFAIYSDPRRKRWHCGTVVFKVARLFFAVCDLKPIYENRPTKYAHRNPLRPDVVFPVADVPGI